MGLGDAERGVSELIGFLFVFTTVTTLLVLWQVNVVPAQNAEVEFGHYESVKDDMIDLHGQLHTVAGRNISSSPSVNLGTIYPSRPIALNPAPPQGQLGTLFSKLAEPGALVPLAG
ncbi:MAG: hypothetical protein ABEI11_03435, partial [Haloarculaceae archaeon]